MHLVTQGATAKRKKKWKGNFWFYFAVSVSEKNTISLSLLIAHICALTATAFGGNSKFYCIILHIYRVWKKLNLSYH
jgi:hypothetical protein